jgi:hypothetical protein
MAGRLAAGRVKSSGIWLRPRCALNVPAHVSLRRNKLLHRVDVGMRLEQYRCKRYK